MNMKSICKYRIVAVALLLGLVSYNVYAQQTKTKSQDVKAETKQKEVKQRGNDRIVVSADDIAHVVATWTKIPVKKLAEEESERLLRLEKFFITG